MQMRMPQLNHFSGTQIWNTLAESWPALFLFIVCLLTRLLLYHKLTFLIQYVMVLQATDDGPALGGPSFLSPWCITHFLPILFHWGTTLNIRYVYWNSPPHTLTHTTNTHTHTPQIHTHTHHKYTHTPQIHTHTTNTHTHTTHIQGSIVVGVY